MTLNSVLFSDANVIARSFAKALKMMKIRGLSDIRIQADLTSPTGKNFPDLDTRTM